MTPLGNGNWGLEWWRRGVFLAFWILYNFVSFWDVSCESHSVMFNSLRLHGLYSPWNSPGQNTGEGSLLQRIFPTQGSNPGLSHCRRLLYQLHYKGSPWILEWVAYPFSRGSSNPEIELGSPTLHTGSWPTELSGKPCVFLNSNHHTRQVT